MVMKKIICAFVCVCMLVSSVSFTVYAQDSSKTVWTKSTEVATDASLGNVIDADSDTTLASENLTDSTAWRIFFDMAPDGGEVKPYSKVKIFMEKYNAKKISVYTSDKVYNVIGKETTPPKETMLSTVRFKNYTSPVATEAFQPYYISVTGEEEYPAAVAMNFEETTDRFVCIEITTAYDSKSEDSEYFGINNEISEIKITGALPESMELDSDSDKLTIPAPGEDSKEIAFSVKVYDEDGGEIEKEDFLDFVLSLAEDYPGISVEGNVIKISTEASSDTIVVKASLTAEGYEHITTEKEITLLPADMTPYLVEEAAEEIEFSMISNQRIDSVSRNLNLIFYGFIVYQTVARYIHGHIRIFFFNQSQCLK